MPSCWTCGSPTVGDQHSCVECQTLGVLKEIEGNIDQHSADDNMLEVAQLAAMAHLQATMQKGFGMVVSAVRWGTETLQWELRKQTDVLKNIDQTLKTPSETQANEWRLMADELLRRGVLADAQEFYRKALDLNRLDYRIYVGLAQTLIRQHAFDEADRMLERSRPHAPKASSQPSRIADWRSNSRRLQAHIRQCRDRPREAVEKLQLAVDLSPCMHEAWYDLAQSAAATGDEPRFANALGTAIREHPAYWQLLFTDAHFSANVPQRVTTLKAIAQPLLAVTSARCKREMERFQEQKEQGLDLIRAKNGEVTKRFWIRCFNPRSVRSVMQAEWRQFGETCDSLEARLRTTATVSSLRLDERTFERLQEFESMIQATASMIDELPLGAEVAECHIHTAASQFEGKVYSLSFLTILLTGIAIMLWSVIGNAVQQPQPW